MPIRLILSIPIFILVAIKTHANSKPWEDFKSQVKEYTESQIHNEISDFDDIEISIGYLDRRIKLNKCDHDLKIHKRFGRVSQGRLSLEVSCEYPKSWKIKIPVSIKIYKDIVTAQESLPRGTLIQKEHLIFSKQDITKSTRGYFDNSEEIIGKVAYRSIRQGAIIKPSMIREPIIVKKGSTVSILGQGQGINIRAHGIALKDGIRGERIPVRNQSSKRVIEAVVSANNTVVINL